MEVDLQVLPVRSDTSPLFDAYVMVDWSAATGPKTRRDSIWIAAASWRSGRLDVCDATNPPTRDDATSRVAALLAGYADAGLRVLIGFDFPYGYPAGLAGLLPRPGLAPWHTVWNTLGHLLEDDGTNHSNRFAVALALNRHLGRADGPFWVAGDGVGDGLPGRKPAFPCRVRGTDLSEYRIVEEHLRSRSYQPKSVWQMYAPGSVGSQAITGIPRLAALRDDPRLAACSEVWPFETGWCVRVGARPWIVHAEIWPGVVSVQHDLHQVKDAAQVLSLVAWCARRDRCGELGAAFSAPSFLTADQDRVVREEEGWILGSSTLPTGPPPRRGGPG